MKPIREFSANEGEYSTGIAGPDAIENDLDTINRMFDPLTEHTNGETGGIGESNVQNGASSDRVIGNRTINDSISAAYSNTGSLTNILSWIAKIIKSITGENSWFASPKDSIKNIDTRLTNNLNSINSLNNSKADKVVIDALQQSISTNATNISNTNTNLSNHKNSSDHDARYYTKEQIEPRLKDGETVIKYEIFNIVSSNDGNGTFRYMNADGVIKTGTISPEGYQVFTLEKGTYPVGKSRIECIINDTLHRSKASGGLAEITNTTFALTFPEGNGAEITVKYYEKIGLFGEHALSHGENGTDVIIVAESMLKNDLKTKINTIQTTANTALSNANAAQTTANSGVTKADNAQNTANTAITNASNAQSTANTALANANTALGRLGVKVTVGTTQPTSPSVNDIWIEV